jgi:hypothetical protein
MVALEVCIVTVLGFSLRCTMIVSVFGGDEIRQKETREGGRCSFFLYVLNLNLLNEIS